MSGRVPPSSLAQVRDAVDLYEQFTGMKPEGIRPVRLVVPKVGLVIGECAGVLYDTVRDGVPEQYIHKFRKSSRPLLVASSDGKTLLILGGGFQFTERGIVDT